MASIVPDSFLARFEALDLRAELEPHFIAESDLEAFDPNESQWQAALGTPDLIAALAAPQVDQALASGSIVVWGLEEKPTMVRLDDVEYPAVEYPVSVLRFGMPRVLIPESRLDEFEEVERRPQALFILERFRPMKSSVRSTALTWKPLGAYPVLSAAHLYALAFGATLVAVLLVVALITAETDEEIRTIVAVGAAGSIRRRFLGLLTGYQTAVAVALAVPLGVLLVWVFSSAEEYFYPGPFGQVSSSGLVVPLWALPWPYPSPW